MRLFVCTQCQNTVYFESTRCVVCDSQLAFSARSVTMMALDAEGLRLDHGQTSGGVHRLCINAAHGACNWLAEDDDDYCLACRHNLMIPDLTRNDNLDNWRKIEQAKHMLFYSLLRLRLPVTLRRAETPRGLGFQFLCDDPFSGLAFPVMTGHEHGLITLNVAEASDAEREARRVALGEPFRTLVGHFRHEIGHYYWDRLVRDGGRLEACRAVFGDDSQDYAASLQRHYTQGALPGWEMQFISAYASAHPWEDFAETFSHYIHIVDALETAQTFGLRTRPQTQDADLALAGMDFDPYQAVALSDLIDAFVPLTVAVNSISRSLGQLDLYPFVLTEAVIGKLAFIHDLLRAVHPGAAAPPASPAQPAPA